MENAMNETKPTGAASGLSDVLGGATILQEMLIACRSSVRLDLSNYERVLDEMDRSDQQRTDAYTAVSKERTRLFRLLNKIDALTTTKSKLPKIELNSGDMFHGGYAGPPLLP